MNGEQPYTTQEVFDWESGHDSITEGANTINCHYSHFRSERSTKVWEAGRDAALAGKPKPAFDPRAMSPNAQTDARREASRSSAELNNAGDA